jgi:hypothetical protein
MVLFCWPGNHDDATGPPQQHSSSSHATWSQRLVMDLLTGSTFSATTTANSAETIPSSSSSSSHVETSVAEMSSCTASSDTDDASHDDVHQYDHENHEDDSTPVADNKRQATNNNTVSGDDYDDYSTISWITSHSSKGMNCNRDDGNDDDSSCSDNWEPIVEEDDDEHLLILDSGDVMILDCDEEVEDDASLSLDTVSSLKETRSFQEARASLAMAAALVGKNAAHCRQRNRFFVMLAVNLLVGFLMASGLWDQLLGRVPLRHHNNDNVSLSSAPSPIFQPYTSTLRDDQERRIISILPPSFSPTPPLLATQAPQIQTKAPFFFRLSKNATTDIMVRNNINSFHKDLEVSNPPLLVHDQDHLRQDYHHPCVMDDHEVIFLSDHTPDHTIILQPLLLRPPPLLIMDPDTQHLLLQKLWNQLQQPQQQQQQQQQRHVRLVLPALWNHLVKLYQQVDMQVKGQSQLAQFKQRQRLVQLWKQFHD